MSKLTLEQVRDEIRNTARAGAMLEPQTCHYLADAIDAELKAREEPVAFRYLMPVGHAFAWTRWLDAETRHLHPIDDGRKVEYVYTAPPTPKIEVTDAVLKRAVDMYEQACGGPYSRMAAALEAALEDTP